jgi:hypothetical protein
MIYFGAGLLQLLIKVISISSDICRISRRPCGDFHHLCRPLAGSTRAGWANGGKRKRGPVRQCAAEFKHGGPEKD